MLPSLKSLLNRHPVAERRIGSAAAAPTTVAAPAPVDVTEARTDVVVDLTLDRIRELVDTIAAEAGRSDAPFGTYVFTPDEPGADLARHVEQLVFEESFGNSPEATEAEYAAYEGATVFICVLDHRRSLPVGAIRLVLPGAAGFKTMDDIADHWHTPPADAMRSSGMDRASGATWDIATLSVAPGYRNGVVSLALYQATTTMALRCGVQWFITVLDVVVLRLLQLGLRRPFARFPGLDPQDYFGSVSVPCVSDVTAWADRLASADPTLYETLFIGAGLEPAVSHPDWHEAAAVLTEVMASASSVSGRPPRELLRTVA